MLDRTANQGAHAPSFVVLTVAACSSVATAMPVPATGEPDAVWSADVSANHSAPGLEPVGVDAPRHSTDGRLVMAGLLGFEPGDLARLEPCVRVDPISGDATLDANCVLEALRQRYQALDDHRETGWMTEEIRGVDGVSRRTETRVAWTADDGHVEIERGARRLRGLIGRMIPTRGGPGPDALRQRLDDWIVPHAVLVREDAGDLGVTAASAVRSADDRPMVRLDMSDAASDRVELLVNPGTLLVEEARVDRDLPGGGHAVTRFEVVDPPMAATSADEPRRSLALRRRGESTATAPIIGEAGADAADERVVVPVIEPGPAAADAITDPAEAAPTGDAAPNDADVVPSG